METDPCETAWASYLECDDARVSRSSRGTKSVVSGKPVEGQKLVGTVVRPRAPCNPSRIYGDVGKLVTPVDCKSAARKALLVRLQSSPPRANRSLVSMHGFSMFVSFNGCYRN